MTNAEVGVKPARKKRGPASKWTRKSVIAEIQRVAAQNDGAAAGKKVSRGCVDAAQRLFGSWSEACAAAGVVSAGEYRRGLRRQKQEESQPVGLQINNAAQDCDDDEKKRWYNLAKAVVLQAVRDFRSGGSYRADAMRFMRSELFNLYTDIDGRWLLDRLLAEEARKRERKRGIAKGVSGARKY